MRLLESAFGEETTGRTFVESALRSSRRTALPTEVEPLLDFVRAHLVGPLTEELGPRMVSALLDDLATELRGPAKPKMPSRAPVPPQPTDAPKSSGVRFRASVLLCDADRLARASLARSLMSTSYDVAAADTPLDVLSLHTEIDVAILDMNIPEVAAVLGAIRTKQPDIRVIAVTNDPPAAETLIRAASVRHYRIVPRGMRPHELGVLIKRLSVA